MDSYRSFHMHTVFGINHDCLDFPYEQLQWSISWRDDVMAIIEIVQLFIVQNTYYRWSEPLIILSLRCTQPLGWLCLKVPCRLELLLSFPWSYVVPFAFPTTFESVPILFCWHVNLLWRWSMITFFHAQSDSKVFQCG